MAMTLPGLGKPVFSRIKIITPPAGTSIPFARITNKRSIRSTIVIANEKSGTDAMIILSPLADRAGPREVRVAIRQDLLDQFDRSVVIRKRLIRPTLSRLIRVKVIYLYDSLRTQVQESHMGRAAPFGTLRSPGAGRMRG